MQLSDEMLSRIDYSKNRILIDWFSFSSKIDSFETMADLLGMSHCSWEELKGVNGYSTRYYFDGISIHYAGDNSVRFAGSNKEEVLKGAWLEMSGSGCRSYETYSKNKGDKWQLLIDYVIENQENITVNRLDLAYDDFLGFLDINKIVEDTYSHNFISKFRSSPQIISTVGDEIAYTVEHGRMRSDTFIRIYDKRLEQNAQQFTDHWIRNEIMLRHDRAFAAISLLTNKYEYYPCSVDVIDVICDDIVEGREFIEEKHSINEVYFFIMNNYLRYIVPSESDSNRWRAPIAEHWENFAHSVTTYRISLWSSPGTDYSSLQLDHYVEKMCASAVYTYIKIHGVDRLIDECNKKFLFLAPKYRILLSQLEDGV